MYIDDILKDFKHNYDPNLDTDKCIYCNRPTNYHMKFRMFVGDNFICGECFLKINLYVHDDNYMLMDDVCNNLYFEVQRDDFILACVFYCDDMSFRLEQFRENNGHICDGYEIDKELKKIANAKKPLIIKKYMPFKVGI